MHEHIKQQHQVQRATDELILSDQQLFKIAQTFAQELNSALDGSTDSSKLQVFPTFIDQLPEGNERGHYLALDLGGTNFRCLLIQLEGDRQSSLVNRTYSISQQLMQGRGEDLFDYIASCLFNFVKENGLLGIKLKLGFTFSFPCKQKSRNQAVLSKWTKGFTCSGVVSRDIGEMLKCSIGKYKDLHIDVAAILNDTTGTLISCAYQEPDCRMGVIIGKLSLIKIGAALTCTNISGTGVNICYMESHCLDREMIINTELGAFGSANQCLDFVRTQWDKQLDESSINRGQQLFEKMVSGMYLGEIVRTIVVNLMKCRILNCHVFGAFTERNCFNTSAISCIELDTFDSTSFPHTQSVLESMSIRNATLADCASLHLICSRVSARSAHLTSAVIAALLHRMDRPQTVIGVDGSVYRCHPHFKTAVNEKVAQVMTMLGGDDAKGKKHFRLMLSEDGSGRGAALIASLSTASTYQCAHCQDCDRLGQIECPTCVATA